MGPPVMRGFSLKVGPDSEIEDYRTLAMGQETSLIVRNSYSNLEKENPSAATPGNRLNRRLLRAYSDLAENVISLQM